MQTASEQLLASPALPFEENGRVGSRRSMKLLQYVAQLAVFADNARRAAPLGHLLLEENVLGHHPALGDGPLHHQQQVVGIDGLREKIRRAFAHCGHGILNAAVRRHHDDWKLGVHLLRSPQNAEAVACRQFEIGEHDCRTRLTELVNRLSLVSRFEDDVALRLERMAKHGAQRILVFDKEDGKRRYRGHQTCFMSFDCLIITESPATRSPGQSHRRGARPPQSCGEQSTRQTRPPAGAQRHARAH